MVQQTYKGYAEGADVTKIPFDYLTYPSKNVLCYKDSVITRKGLENDGTAQIAGAVHSEYVWKSAPGGAKSLKVAGVNLYVKVGSLWILLFAGFTTGTTRVRFAPWVDINGTVIKSRLLMVDGSDKIFEWNGSIGTVASYAADTITVSETGTLLALGFDPGNATAQAVRVVRLSAGVVAGIEAYNHDDACADLALHLASTPSPVPVAGDYVMSAVKTRTTLLAGIDKDDIYVYKNHAFVSNLDSGRVYYSHSTTYAEATGILYTIPGTKTALTADLLDLDGKVTAMISRKNVLWISTTDDWFKITKTAEVNAYGYWTNVEKFEQAERNGALPYAVAIQKGDIIFVGQNKYYYRITSLEIVGTDDLRLISDNIEGMLLRLDKTDVRIYYDSRYIFVIYPVESTLIMLDLITGEFQPPQVIPMSCMSVISGVRYGHSSARNETFEMFTGRDDLGVDIDAVIAPGYLSGEHPFRYQKHTMFGIHARATVTTIVTVNHYYEESGAKGANEAVFTVGDIKLYEVSDDVSFAAQALATRSLAGVEDSGDNSLKPFFVFDKYTTISWFNYRTIFTITGSEVEFQLLGFYIDNELSDRKIGSDLFIPRE